MDVVLGIDIGTTSTEGLLVGLPTGSVVARCTVGYAPGFTNPEGLPLGAEQRPEVWRDAMLRVTNEMALEAEKLDADIRAMAASSMVAGLNIPVDGDFNPLRAVPIWLDQRAVGEAATAASELDADTLIHVTGNGRASPYFGYVKLLWYMAHDIEDYRMTHALLTPQGWLVWMLTGEHVWDTTSLGVFGGLLDLGRRRVSLELADELARIGSELAGEDLGISPDLFGRVVEPWDLVGPVTPGGAALSGLPEGIPVVASGVDAPVATMASGSRGPGDNTLTMGTSWCLGVLTEGATTPRSGDMVHMPHVFRGKTLMFSMTGGPYTGGSAGFWMPELVTGAGFKDLEREAGLVPPGAGGVTFLPYLMGDRAPLGRTDASGAFLGLRAEHSRGHLFRAVMEGGAMLHKECLQGLRGMGVEPRPTRVVDHHYRSGLWRSILADVTGETLLYLPNFPGTAYGDAMLAAISAGQVSEDRAFSWVPEARPVDPTQDPDRLEGYRRAEERFIRYRDRLGLG